MLLQGAANRKVAATNMNRASSRSHSVFTCVIESKVGFLTREMRIRLFWKCFILKSNLSKLMTCSVSCSDSGSPKELPTTGFLVLISLIWPGPRGEKFVGILFYSRKKPSGIECISFVVFTTVLNASHLLFSSRVCHVS